MMNDFSLANMKKFLIGCRNDILTMSAACRENFNNGEIRQALGSGLDEGDCSTINHYQYLHSLKFESFNRTLQLIDRALEKIEEGKYGICVDCHEVINEKRLRSIPFAVYCKDCQEKMDKGGKVWKGR